MSHALFTYFCSEKEGSRRNSISMEHGEWVKCIESVHVNYRRIYTKLWSKMEKIKIFVNEISLKAISFSWKSFQYGDFIMRHNCWIICMDYAQISTGCWWKSKVLLIFSLNNIADSYWVHLSAENWHKLARFRCTQILINFRLFLHFNAKEAHKNIERESFNINVMLKTYTCSLWPISWIKFAALCLYDSSNSALIPLFRLGELSNCSSVKSHLESLIINCLLTKLTR